jgi:Helicase associated domain.
MTQEKRWYTNYEEVMLFLKKNGRNLSKYNLEERRLYTWVKHQRKMMNQVGLKPDRQAKFQELLTLCEQNRRKNQYL